MLAGEQITIARAGVPVVDLVVHRDTEVVFGLGKGEYEHDPEVFDGVDSEVAAMFYGSPA